MSRTCAECTSTLPEPLSSGTPHSWRHSSGRQLVSKAPNYRGNHDDGSSLRGAGQTDERSICHDSRNNGRQALLGSSAALCFVHGPRTRAVGDILRRWAPRRCQNRGAAASWCRGRRLCAPAHSAPCTLAPCAQANCILGALAPSTSFVRFWQWGTQHGHVDCPLQMQSHTPQCGRLLACPVNTWRQGYDSQTAHVHVQGLATGSAPEAMCTHVCVGMHACTVGESDVQH